MTLTVGEMHETITGVERVRRATHRFDRQRPPPDRIGRVQLRVAHVAAQLHAEAGRRFADLDRPNPVRKSGERVVKGRTTDITRGTEIGSGFFDRNGSDGHLVAIHGVDQFGRHGELVSVRGLAT